MSGSEGPDTLSNIERLQFADTNIALDTAGNAGEVYRLYQSAFDRAPLKTGLGYWINVLDQGASLYDVAGWFMQSPEFMGMYGAHPTNTGMVNHFFEHVLHRAPKQTGLDYWTGLLDTHTATPAQVLVAISESPENQAQVIGVIQNGMEYTPIG